MERPAVVLVQKPDSPLAGLVEQALGQECRAVVLRGDEPGADGAAEGSGVVVWDLSGYTAEERAAWAEILSHEQLGIVVVCGAVDDGVRAVLRRTGALAVVAMPLYPAQVAAAVEMALAAQGRLNALLAERAELQCQLGEREVIEKAKRLLMIAANYGEDDAMRQMQKQARNTNQRLVEVAQRVIKAYKIFNGD